MATVFSHALVGCTLVSLLPKSFQTKRNFLLAAGSAMLPDLDYVGFILHIPYNSIWGHRGITHSILFALLIGLLLAFFQENGRRHIFLMSLFFALTTLSHGVFDALTNGGLGVAFYAPYNISRYFFPWNPIEVSPLGLRFLSERGLVVMISEFYWIWIPCLLILSMNLFFKKTRESR